VTHRTLAPARIWLAEVLTAADKVLNAGSQSKKAAAARARR